MTAPGGLGKKGKKARASVPSNTNYNSHMGDSANALDELRKIVGHDAVLDASAALSVYESDALTIAKGRPWATVLPTDTQQVADCVRLLDQYGLSIVARGSGTGVTGGSIAFDGAVLLTTTRMTRIEMIDIPNRVAVIQAGVRNAVLSDAVADAGWYFSPDPSSERAATIGGNAATNAGGINTLKQGATTNHILGIEYVLPGGTIARTRTDKLYDGIGPDLPGLICGSEGTLGILTRLWCRIIPKPRHFRTVYAVFDSIASACHTVSDVVAEGIVPAAMEMVDRDMIEALETAFQIGFPRDAHAMLLIETEGIPAVVDEQLEQILLICRKQRATQVRQCSSPQERSELWKARKKAAGAVGRISRSYCVQDACIPRSKLAGAMEYILKLGRRAGIRITNVFHAGDGNIHPLLLFDERDSEQVQRVLRLSNEILEYCVTIGGTITGEHGVGIEKLHLMDRMFNRATLDTFFAIKKTFDPDQRFNEAKLVPSDRLSIELLKPIATNVAAGAT